MTLTQEAARKVLERFPNGKSKTLAKILYEENKPLFTGVEHARNIIRYHRGAKGEKDRKVLADRTFQREPQKSGDPFGKIPEGKTHFDKWGAFQIKGPHRALVLSDIHIPYHSRAALVAALDYGRTRDSDLILLNGDVVDFFSVSAWQKDPRKRDLAGEVKIAREFLAALRGAFPKARIVYKLGNHEERWERYLEVKAPELLGVEDFTIDRVLRLSEIGAEVVRYKRPIMLGDLPVIHGHEYNFAISNPVNPARGFFLRAQTHCLGGHLHQTSQHSASNLNGKVISCWSTGCLADLHPDYRPLNNTNHGFAHVEVDTSEAFRVDNLRIIDGRIY